MNDLNPTKKNWINKALAILDNSLFPIPQELNEIDWKLELTTKPEKLSKHLSAMANLPGGGYLVFGIEDKAGQVVGISKQNIDSIIERISNISRDSLNPVVKIDHSIELYQSKALLFIHIHESSVKPVHTANGTLEDTFIRTGGSTRKASRQEIGALMLNSKNPQFEELHSSKIKSETEVLALLDYAAIYKLLKTPIPQSADEIMRFLESERMIENFDGAGYYITNLGALSAAHSLNDFDGLTRKSIRVIKYKGKNKLVTEKEYPMNKGYAIAFEELMGLLDALLPGSEIIKKALREETTIYPEIALRELIANALIHQDFAVKGSGPMIEIFTDRVEISNPGKLLPTKKIDRLIRTTPESRNELLASVFRRFNICEERGSGFEKAVAHIELYGLPPLKFEELENSFRVTMYSPKTFAEMTVSERIEASYQHSIIQYYARGGMTNTSLRERFKMHEKQRSQVSRVIKDSVAMNRIKPKDPNNPSSKFTEYVPYWV